MRIIIFTEIGHKIGYGHVVRCSVLYDFFEEIGKEVCFVLFGKEDDYGVLGDRKKIFINWHNPSELSVLSLCNEDIAIIDSYIADICVYEYISKKVKKAVYIDDNERLNYPPGIVLSPEVYSAAPDYLNADRSGVFFGGEKFVLIRRDFNYIIKRINENVENVFISMGGTDSTEIICNIVDSVVSIYKGITVNVVSPFSIKPKHIIGNLNIYKDINAAKMKDLMAQADIAISAGGQTLYELIKVGTPTFAYCLADNQRKSIKYLAQRGIIIEVSDFRDDLISKLNENSGYSDRLKIFNECRRLKLGSGIVGFAEFIVKEY